MGLSSVVQDFLSKDLECSVENSLEAGSPKSETHAFKVKAENILIITEKEKEISLGKFIEYFKAGPRMLSRQETKELTGHPAGCLSPFGLKSPLKVYLDVSLLSDNHISVSAGMKNFVVKVSPGDIEKLTGGQWIDICIN